MATGAVFGVLVMRAAADVKDHCDSTGCDDSGLQAGRSGRPFAVMSPAFIAGGAALAAAGVVWWALAGRGTSPAVAVGPLSASVSGSF
jgi:hypothetical protein